MLLRHIETSILRLAALAAIAGLLAACGGGTSSTPGGNPPASVTISGSVGDGPIIGATITIMDAYGTVIATTTSDDMASYKTNIPEDAAYPLIIAANGGTDLVSGTAPDFEMLSLVYDASAQNANINPFSTLIVKTAQSMPGGLNPANLELATQIITKNVNFGLDTAQVPDPITTVIDEQNVATIVKSSEVLAEMLRRARRSLTASGSTLNEDDLMDRLASDLSDGVIDGAGHPNADPLVAATVNVVSGQVLVEALNNDLYVNGAPATTLMDNAILITTPAATDTTRDAVITQELLDQTRMAINSALTLEPATKINDIPPVLETIPPGASSGTVDTLLRTEVSADFDEVVTLIAYAPETVQAEVNEDVRVEIATSKPPMVSLTATKTSLSGPENQFTLIWATSNATSCAASGPVEWNSNGAASGEKKIRNLDADATFTLTCTNDSILTTTKSISISVTKLADKTPKDDTPENNINIPGAITPPAEPIQPAGNNGNDTGASDTPLAAGDTSGANNKHNVNGYQNILLSWNPSSGNIVGYIVNFGASSDDVTAQFKDIPVTAANFDPQAPSLEIDPVAELGLQPGDNACFSVSAYNMDGVSSPTPAICGII